MGEVRIGVRLVNAADEGRCRRGEIATDQVRQLTTEAVVDTGAVSTVIPTTVMDALGLMARGRRVAQYANGGREEVSVTEPFIVHLLGRDTTEEALVLGDVVLIGQTVLEKLDLVVDCAGRRLMPNPDHPDRPVTMVR